MNETLIKNVIEALGYDYEEDLENEELLSTLNDICTHGASGGFSGFTYYSDTINFYDRNKIQIIKLLESLADDLGEDPLVMVANFNCIKSDKLTTFQVAEAIYQTNAEHETTIKNVLAWFTLEEIARHITNN